MVSRATELQRFSLSASAPQRSQNPSLRSERPLIYRTTLYINYSVEYRYVWVSLATCHRLERARLLPFTITSKSLFGPWLHTFR